MADVKNKITFVLPLSINSKREKLMLNDLDRAQIFLLHSFRKFVDPNIIEKIIIIIPPNEFEKVTQTLKPFATYLPIEFKSDDDICPELSSYSGWGWFKQQILKLVISNFVDTELYFTLDADMLFTRKVGYSDFVVNGKPQINLQLSIEHTSWWENTSKLMGYDFSTYQVEEFEPSFTPVLMKTIFVRELMEKIKEKSGDKLWISYLMDIAIEGEYNGSKIMWTEYCLYYLFVQYEKGGIKNNYHFDKDNSYNFFVGPSIWNQEMFYNLTEEGVAEMFDPNRYHFVVVVQSFIEVPVEKIVEKLNLFFKL